MLLKLAQRCKPGGTDSTRSHAHRICLHGNHACAMLKREFCFAAGALIALADCVAESYGEKEG